MPRFFYPHPLSLQAALILSENIAHHIYVLRLKQNDSLILFNGQGGEYEARITHISKKEIIVDIIHFFSNEIELPYELTLAQALPESNKIDWILEKSVELGARHFIPLQAQRCVVRLSLERAEKKAQHWQNILIAATEQSGRNRLCTLAPVQTLSTWLSQAQQELKILLTPRANLSLSEWAQNTTPQSTTLMIGPEGGFSPEEEQMAKQQGALLLSMGPRILRTETAGLAALATLNAYWEK